MSSGIEIWQRVRILLILLLLQHIFLLVLDVDKVRGDGDSFSLSDQPGVVVLLQSDTGLGAPVDLDDSLQNKPETTTPVGRLLLFLLLYLPLTSRKDI